MIISSGQVGMGNSVTSNSLSQLYYSRFGGSNTSVSSLYNTLYHNSAGGNLPGSLNNVSFGNFIGVECWYVKITSTNGAGTTGSYGSSPGSFAGIVGYTGSVNDSGGSGNFHFSFSSYSANGTSFNTGNTFPAGSYTLQVYDNNHNGNDQYMNISFNFPYLGLQGNGGSYNYNGAYYSGPGQSGQMWKVRGQ